MLQPDSRSHRPLACNRWGIAITSTPFKCWIAFVWPIRKPTRFLPEPVVHGLIQGKMYFSLNAGNFFE